MYFDLESHLQTLRRDKSNPEETKKDYMQFIIVYSYMLSIMIKKQQIDSDPKGPTRNIQEANLNYLTSKFPKMSQQFFLKYVHKFNFRFDEKVSENTLLEYKEMKEREEKQQSMKAEEYMLKGRKDWDKMEVIVSELSQYSSESQVFKKTSIKTTDCEDSEPKITKINIVQLFMKLKDDKPLDYVKKKNLNVLSKSKTDDTFNAWQYK